MTTLQRQLSNGSWVDETDQNRINGLLDDVLAREVWFAPRKNRTPMTTREQVIEYLTDGQTIRHDDDWFANLRFTSPVPNIHIETPGVACDCGHTSRFPMNASRGTSCPDCYDRMSN